MPRDDAKVPTTKKKNSKGKVRYAVVGIGYISQVAVLPAFRNAARNSELTALVSDDPVKLDELGKRYEVPHTFTYERYDECLRSGDVDAVYIALPNDMHCRYAVAAAEAGVHVLCEKPLAVTTDECNEMIRAAEQNGVRLMTAYRLHFEKANVKAAEMVRAGELGTPRFFSSTFSLQVKEGNIRLHPAERGGGPLYDLGVYCINAARTLFAREPVEVRALTASGPDPRFQDVHEMLSAILRFPDEALAAFTCSFGAADTSEYRILGTEGELRVEPAYDYSVPLVHHRKVDGVTKKTTFPRRDQFAPELLHFSECVLRGKEPEPSGREGLADVRVIEALLRSAASGKAVRLEPFERRHAPLEEIRKPPVREPDLVHAESPSHD